MENPIFLPQDYVRVNVILEQRASFSQVCYFLLKNDFLHEFNFYISKKYALHLFLSNPREFRFRY